MAARNMVLTTPEIRYRVVVPISQIATESEVKSSTHEFVFPGISLPVEHPSQDKASL